MRLRELQGADAGDRRAAGADAVGAAAPRQRLRRGRGVALGAPARRTPAAADRGRRRRTGAARDRRRDPRRPRLARPHLRRRDAAAVARATTRRRWPGWRRTPTAAPAPAPPSRDTGRARCVGGCRTRGLPAGAVRFALPRGVETIVDRARGRTDVDLATLADPVLQRRDGCCHLHARRRRRRHRRRRHRGGARRRPRRSERGPGGAVARARRRSAGVAARALDSWAAMERSYRSRIAPRRSAICGSSAGRPPTCGGSCCPGSG